MMHQDTATLPTDRLPLKVHVRWMTRFDMPSVLAIEKDRFQVPWSEEDFLKCLRQRNCIGMVTEHNEKVVGFMIYELLEHRIELINLAVHPAYSRRFVGRQMIANLAGKLASHRRRRITLIIGEWNLSGQQFFRACGFRATGVRRGWFEDLGQDGYVFAYAPFRRGDA